MGSGNVQARPEAKQAAEIIVEWEKGTLDKPK
jgi:hypothetical protein